MGPGKEVFGSGPVFEPPAVVAYLDDVAVVGDAVEKRSGHLSVVEDALPFAEGEIDRDDHRGLFVELADQVKEHLAAGTGERAIGQFIEHNEINP